LKSAVTELIAIDATPHISQRLDRGRMTDGDRITVLQAKSVPGGVRERGLIVSDKIRRDLIESRNDMLIRGA
jgi:hypothetical protein